MKILGFLLAVGVWCFVGFSFLHRNKTFTPPASSHHVYAAPERPAELGPLVLIYGKVLEVVDDQTLLIECHRNIASKNSDYVLDSPFYSRFEGHSELEGTYVLSGYPKAVVDDDQVSCIAALSGRVSYVTVLGGKRTVRTLKWQDPSEVANYHPEGKAPTASDWQSRFGNTMANQPATNSWNRPAPRGESLKPGWGTSLDQSAHR